jgi:hypothetical protein
MTCFSNAGLRPCPAGPRIDLGAEPVVTLPTLSLPALPVVTVFRILKKFALTLLAALSVFTGTVAGQTVTPGITLNGLNFSAGSIDTVTEYADLFNGADACAKISAACAALPSNGGVVDARAFSGAQNCAAAPSCSTGNVRFLLGGVSLLIPGPWNLNQNAQIIQGSSRENSWIQTTSPTADIIQINAEYDEVRSVGLASTGGVTRTGGAAIDVSPGTTPGGGTFAVIDNVLIQSTWDGILQPTTSGFMHVHDLHCEVFETPGYVTIGTGSNSCIHQGTSTTNLSGANICCSLFDEIQTNQTPWSTAAIVLDANTNAETFSNMQLGAGNPSTSILLQNTTGFSGGPSNITFQGGQLEGFGAGAATVKINACANCMFTGMSLLCGGASNCVVLGANAQNTMISNSVIGGAAGDGILINPGALNTVLTGNTIGDANSFPTGTSSNIHIAANAGSATITGNTFDHTFFSCIFGQTCTFTPKADIQIDAGTGDNIVFSGNTCGDFSTSCIINNNVTGSNITFSGNTNAGNSNTGPMLINWQCSGTGPTSGIIVRNGSPCSTFDGSSFISLPSSGTLRNLQVNCFTPGHAAGSGVVSINLNGPGTGIGCTTGTGVSCSDFTHAVHYVAGGELQLSLTGVPGETLAGCSFSLEKW